MMAYVVEHPGCTQEAIMNAVHGNKTKKLRVFQAFVDKKSLVQTGKGVKGAPYTYDWPGIAVESSCEDQPEI